MSRSRESAAFFCDFQLDCWTHEDPTRDRGPTNLRLKDHIETEETGLEISITFLIHPFGSPSYQSAPRRGVLRFRSSGSHLPKVGRGVADFQVKGPNTYRFSRGFPIEFLEFLSCDSMCICFAFFNDVVSLYFGSKYYDRNLASWSRHQKIILLWEGLQHWTQ